MKKIINVLLSFMLVFTSLTVTHAVAPTPPTDLVATLDTQNGDIVVSSADQTYIDYSQIKLPPFSIV